MSKGIKLTSCGSSGFPRRKLVRWENRVLATGNGFFCQRILLSEL